MVVVDETDKVVRAYPSFFLPLFHGKDDFFMSAVAAQQSNRISTVCYDR